MGLYGVFGPRSSSIHSGSPGTSPTGSCLDVKREQVMTVKELWERVQEMFMADQQTQFEQWLKSRYPQNIADLERLETEWYRSSQFRQVF